MTKYKSGQIMKDASKENDPSKYCCLHKNIVPIEIGFACITYPNGYEADPNYNFAINLIGANIARVKSYLCLDCKMEIKAPSQEQTKKDILI